MWIDWVVAIWNIWSTFGEIVMMFRGKAGRLRVQVENKYLFDTLEAAISQPDQCDEHRTAPTQLGK